MRRLARFPLRALGARYPFHRSARIVHNPLTRWATASLREPEPIRCRNGLVVHAIPSDLIGRQLYLTGTWDPHLLMVLEELARGSEVLVDVGANVGFFALSMAAAAPEACCTCPRAHILFLADLIERACRPNVWASPGDDPSFCSLRELREGDAARSLATTSACRGSASATAPGEATIPISLQSEGTTFSKASSVPGIDLMKIDVEGHEAQVLRGMESLAVHAQSTRHRSRSSRPRRRSELRWIPSCGTGTSSLASTRD